MLDIYESSLSYNIFIDQNVWHNLITTHMNQKEKGRFGDRHCDLTVIGDLSHVDIFADKLKSCFLTNDEIDLWNKGHDFKDPWPKKIVTLKKE
ncbi:MAG TPA: hypothetical protein DCF84_06440 [Bacteroidetes bacterium]|nr:hypothetical protein [Bacteroidota bacterium]|tara:strand:- start:1098 stop:1376 length:279 start_codon:yes stop_codon:yes gene_type:complete